MNAMSRGATCHNLAWFQSQTALTADAISVAVALSAGALGTSAAGTAVSLPAAMALGSLVLLLLAVRGAYRGQFGRELPDEILGVLQATVEATALLVLLRVVAGADGDAARETALLGGVLAAALPFGRLALWFARRPGNGRALSPTLILGAGKVGHLTAERLRRMPELGLEPVGFLDADPLDLSHPPSAFDRLGGSGELDAIVGCEGIEHRRRGSSGLPVLGSPEDLDRIIDFHGIEHVIVAFSQGQHESMLSAIRRCWAHGLAVSVVPRFFEIEGERVGVKHVGGLPLISLRSPQTRGFGLSVKYAADRVLAAAGLGVLLPLLGLIAAAVAASSGRPILYAQPRMGRDGRPFKLWKFRTMAPAPGGAGEPRCTRVGSFLRRRSLDELPQLWNVLLGEMSLIGPRPERVHYVANLEQSIHRYPDRHRVKAGMTGWAQVHGLRGETSLADRVEWDNYYIDNWSLWLDAKILLRTVGSVFTWTDSPAPSSEVALMARDEPVIGADDRVGADDPAVAV